MNDPFSPFPIPVSPRCERRRPLIETSDIVSGPAKSRWNLGGWKTRVGIPRGKPLLNAIRGQRSGEKSYFGTLASALCPNKERCLSSIVVRRVRTCTLMAREIALLSCLLWPQRAAEKANLARGRRTVGKKGGRNRKGAFFFFFICPLLLLFLAACHPFHLRGREEGKGV